MKENSTRCDQSLVPSVDAIPKTRWLFNLKIKFDIDFWTLTRHTGYIGGSILLTLSQLPESNCLQNNYPEAHTKKPTLPLSREHPTERQSII